MVELNAEIVGRLIGSPGGIYGDELAIIAPDYKEQIEALLGLGAEIDFAADPDGRKYCTLTNPERVQEILQERSGRDAPDTLPGAAESHPPAPPPSTSPPAETPAAGELGISIDEEVEGWNQEKVMLEMPGTLFRARSLNVDQRKVTIRPASKEDAARALSFAMDVQPSDMIEVRMSIQHKPKAMNLNQEDAEVPKDPKDYKTVGTIVKPPKEADPAKKSRQQLDTELSEQVQKGELSTTLADASARMADL